jgi:hypothetical protein
MLSAFWNPGFLVLIIASLLHIQTSSKYSTKEDSSENRFPSQEILALANAL